MNNSLAFQLAEWCSTLDTNALPSAQHDLARLRALDTIGLITAGQDAEPADALQRFAQRDRGAEESSLIGSTRRVPAARAALVHGALAHAWDFDDTYLDSIVHPGSVIIPTALALGETLEASGSTTSTAISIGYEVAARIGAVAGRAMHARSFHASGIVGPLAAAATAGRLYSLTPGQMTSAFGLAGSMSSGLLNFLNDGGWSKWLHLGWAAQAGINAVQLAIDGFRGPTRVLEGPHGLYDAFTDGNYKSVALVTASLGSEWMNTRAWAKRYPCAHVIAPYIDGVLKLAGTHSLHAKDIQSIECEVEPWTIPIVCEPRASKIAPDSTIEAIASLPYHVAAALVKERVNIDTLGPEVRADANILKLAARVTHTERPDEHDSDGVKGSVRITTVAGSQHEVTVVAKQITEEELRNKFRYNAVRRMSPHKVTAVENAFETAMPSPVALWRLLTD